jgi:hypothetical protein
LTNITFASRSKPPAECRRVRDPRRIDQMRATAELADRLTELLMLAYPPGRRDL